MVLRGLAQQDVNFWRSVALPMAVAGAALAVAIVGAAVVSGEGGIDKINLFVEGTLSGNSQQWLGGLISASAFFALAAGMASAVNPCGFAMLPAYLGLYLGSNANQEQSLSPVRTMGRALLVGGAVSAGFILLFGRGRRNCRSVGFLCRRSAALARLGHRRRAGVGRGLDGGRGQALHRLRGQAGQPHG